MEALHTQSSHRLGNMAILLAAALWGTTGTAAYFMHDSISSMTIGACTMFGGGILLFLLSPQQAWHIIKTQSVRLLLCGSLAITIYPLAFYTGMSIAGVALGNVTAIASAPIFAVLLEKIFIYKRCSFSRVWVFSLIILGIILMIIGNARFHANHSTRQSLYLWGIGLALIAGFTYALYTYISRRIILMTHNSTATMGALFGLGALWLLPIILLQVQYLFSWHTIPIMLYLICAPMFLAYLLFGYGLKYVSASRATILTLVEPLVSVILGVSVTHDHLFWYGWLGVVLTIFGMSIPEDFSFRRKTL